MFSIKSASVLLVSLLAVGCSAEANSDRAASSESAMNEVHVDFQDGSFKLYSDPESTPLPECDVHTSLVLRSDKSGKAVAKLTEVVAGSCEIYVEPDAREFAVEYEMSRCGSLTFSGDAVIKGQTRHIAITDHRQRLCNDVQPAVIVVDEYDRLGNVTTRFAGR